MACGIMQTSNRLWQKQGQIYVPAGDKPWSRSHAQLPMVQQRDGRWRIYFATRNETGQSNINFLENCVNTEEK